MRAILLAAGFGTRLRPITDVVPKCLVPIKGRPLLDIWLQNLSEAGIGPFLINTHYLPEQVEEYISASEYKDRVKLVYEPELLGTAGTLRANADFFEGKDGMLIHADNYCKTDFQLFVRAHDSRPRQCLMTMMAFRTDMPEQCGIIESTDNVLVGFHEKVKSPPGNLANGAIYILNNELIDWIVKEKLDDFSTQVIPHLLGKIAIHENNGFLLDIGNIRSYLNAQYL